MFIYQITLKFSHTRWSSGINDVCWISNRRISTVEPPWTMAKIDRAEVALEKVPFWHACTHVPLIHTITPRPTKIPQVARVTDDYHKIDQTHLSPLSAVFQNIQTHTHTSLPRQVERKEDQIIPGTLCLSVCVLFRNAHVKEIGTSSKKAGALLASSRKNPMCVVYTM